MKKVIFLLFILVLIVNSAYAVEWTNPSYWQLINGTITTSYDLLILGNVSIIGQFVNVTVVDYNITGETTIEGNVTGTDFCLPNGICLSDPSLTYLVDSFNITAGTYLEGNVTDLWYRKDRSLNISEDSGANPLTVQFNFTNLTDGFDYVTFRLSYEGGQGHELEWGIWDYGDNVYEEEYGDETDTDGFVGGEFRVYDDDDHVQNGTVSVQLRHSQNGISSHALYVDYIALVKGTSTGSNIDHDGLSGRDDIENHPQYLDTDATRNITGNLTVEDRIYFFNEEWIDNVVDGWIRVNGNLNVTGEIVAESVNTTTLSINGQEFSIATAKDQSYDTGWIRNNDWTNVQLGSLGNDSNVTHNLDEDLGELEVRLIISTDGTEDNSIEVFIAGVAEDGAGDSGVTIFQQDSNNLQLQTGNTGIGYIQSAGSRAKIDNEDWYYKVIVTRKRVDFLIIDTPEYDTGWINNNDWTSQKLGTVVGGNVSHNLNYDIADLDIHLLISSDGTDTNSFEIGYAALDRSTAGTNYYGYGMSQLDKNSFYLWTLSQGIDIIDTAGTRTIVDTENWYYRVIVRAKEVTVDYKIHDLDISGTLTADNISAPINFGLGGYIRNLVSNWLQIGPAVNISGNLRVYGTSGIYVPEMCYETGWVNTADWTNVLLGDSIGSVINHQLNTNIVNLSVRMIVSTDGTDDNSFEVDKHADWDQGSGIDTGYTLYQDDSNNASLRTATGGIRYIRKSDGAGLRLDTENYYYKVKVCKNIG